MKNFILLLFSINFNYYNCSSSNHLINIKNKLNTAMIFELKIKYFILFVTLTVLLFIIIKFIFNSLKAYRSDNEEYGSSSNTDHYVIPQFAREPNDNNVESANATSDSDEEETASNTSNSMPHFYNKSDYREYYSGNSMLYSSNESDYREPNDNNVESANATSDSDEENDVADDNIVPLSNCTKPAYTPYGGDEENGVTRHGSTALHNTRYSNAVLPTHNTDLANTTGGIPNFSDSDSDHSDTAPDTNNTVLENTTGGILNFGVPNSNTNRTLGCTNGGGNPFKRNSNITVTHHQSNTHIASSDKHNNPSDTNVYPNPNNAADRFNAVIRNVDENTVNDNPFTALDD